MDLLLTKALPLAVYPLGLALILGFLAVLVSFRWRRTGRVLFLVPLVLLWVASMPTTANWLIGDLEQRYPPVSVVSLPSADAIVLLGGLASARPSDADIDFSDAVDRALLAAELHRAGLAPTILVSGGNLPWSDALRPEAELIADLLVELGVPRDMLVLEGESRNTRENAINSRDAIETAGLNRVLLVTSAWHMPRAVDAFTAVGVDVVPAPADARVRARYGNVLDWLPDAEALATTTIAVKEWVGTLVYRIRGWI